VAPQDTPIGGAERTRRLDELAPSQAVGLAARQARVARPADHTEREHYVPHARAEHGRERDREQEPGKRQQHIDDAHEENVEPATGIAGDGAERGADHERRRDGRQADGEGHPPAVQHPRQDVAAELVLPEEMRP